MNVVIFGCGRTGATLALQLSALGHEITIIEQNPASLRRLGNDHKCRIVIGSGLDDDVLLQANVSQANYFFALTRGDNTNLMAAQIVKLKYGVDKVCVKVADPLRAAAYRGMGYHCINPSSLTAGMMRDWMIDAPYQTIDQYNTLITEMEN